MRLNRCRQTVGNLSSAFALLFLCHVLTLDKGGASLRYNIRSGGKKQTSVEYVQRDGGYSINFEAS